MLLTLMTSVALLSAQAEQDCSQLVMDIRASRQTAQPETFNSVDIRREGVHLEITARRMGDRTQVQLVQHFSLSDSDFAKVIGLLNAAFATQFSNERHAKATLEDVAMEEIIARLEEVREVLMKAEGRKTRRPYIQRG